MSFDLQVISVQGIVAALHVMKKDKIVSSYCKADLIGKVVDGTSQELSLPNRHEFDTTVAEFKRIAKLVKVPKHKIRISF